MSKRNRLDKQKAFQKEKAQLELDSKASKKFMKKEPLPLLIIKIIMLASFLYSGFFYGGVTVVGVYTGAMTVTEKGALTLGSANAMLIGILLMLAGLILAFFKRHIISFIASISGTLIYLYVAYERVIKFAAQRVSASGDLNPQTKYMLWYYPIAAFAAGSLALLTVSIVIGVNKKRKARKMRDNAPVKSIIED